MKMPKPGELLTLPTGNLPIAALSLFQTGAPRFFEVLDADGNRYTVELARKQWMTAEAIAKVEQLQAEAGQSADETRKERDQATAKAREERAANRQAAAERTTDLRHLTLEQSEAHRRRDEARISYDKAVAAEDGDLMLERMETLALAITHLDHVDPEYYAGRAPLFGIAELPSPPHAQQLDELNQDHPVTHPNQQETPHEDAIQN